MVTSLFDSSLQQDDQIKFQFLDFTSYVRLHGGSIKHSYIPYQNCRDERGLMVGLSLTVGPNFFFELVLGKRASKLYLIDGWKINV